jgi:hypothetical protein
MIEDVCWQSMLGHALLQSQSPAAPHLAACLLHDILKQ